MKLFNTAIVHLSFDPQAAGLLRRSASVCFRGIRGKEFCLVVASHGRGWWPGPGAYARSAKILYYQQCQALIFKIFFHTIETIKAVALPVALLIACHPFRSIFFSILAERGMDNSSSLYYLNAAGPIQHRVLQGFARWLSAPVYQGNEAGGVGSQPGNWRAAGSGRLPKAYGSQAHTPIAIVSRATPTKRQYPPALQTACT